MARGVCRRRYGGVSFEMPREVGLVVEADRCSDVGRSLAVQQELASSLDPPADQVRVGGNPELGSEAANQVRLGAIKSCRGHVERQVFRACLIKKQAKLRCDAGFSGRGLCWLGEEVVGDCAQ